VAACLGDPGTNVVPRPARFLKPGYVPPMTSWWACLIASLADGLMLKPWSKACRREDPKIIPRISHSLGL